MRMDMLPQNEPEMSLGMQFAQRLRVIVLEYNFEFAELLSGFAAALWGFWLLTPLNTYGSSPSWRTLAGIAPEWLTGLVVCALGLAQLVALLADLHATRKHVSFAMSLIWTFVAIQFGIANFNTPGWLIYGCLALSAAWAFLRIIAERRR